MKMTAERAIEILDPTHREHYDSIEPVYEACRMGMEALKEKLERSKGCSFCQKPFNLNVAGVDEHGLYMATGMAQPPENEKFGFCPVCGRDLREEVPK